MRLVDVVRELRVVGRASWEWDADMGMHIPVCSRWKYDVSKGGIVRCGNGPLNESELANGTCSDGPHLPIHERSF